MANAKALADHQEERLRKLKEELRKAQQEQDVTGNYKSECYLLTVWNGHLRYSITQMVVKQENVFIFQAHSFMCSKSAKKYFQGNFDKVLLEYIHVDKFPLVLAPFNHLNHLQS